MKKLAIWDGMLLCTVAAALALCAVTLFFFPAPRYSAVENRLLADAPTLSAANFFSGEFSESADSYMTERFPVRGFLRRTNAVSELVTGRREVNGVILCRDGSLARRTDQNERALAQNLAILARLPESTVVAVAPRRLEARRAVLPRAYDTAREDMAWQMLADVLPSAVTFPDVTDDAAWFHTDHHWTAAGAYQAYAALGAALGYTPYPREAFFAETVNDRFFGTSDAAAGIPAVAPDRIELWRFAGDGDFRLTMDGMPAPFTGFYDTEKLQTRDGYSVFCGGNCGVLTIDLGENDDRPVLCVIKDSFANVLLPFLARHYRIVAIDPRYQKSDITERMTDADAVLVLFGMQTLAESAVLAPLARI